MVGPHVLIVRVEVMTAVPFKGGLGGLNEHTGGKVTSGVIVVHDKVMPEIILPPTCRVGLLYPLIGLRLITPSLPLPAGTLPGTTGLCTLMVN